MVEALRKPRLDSASDLLDPGSSVMMVSLSCPGIRRQQEFAVQAEHAAIRSSIGSPSESCIASYNSVEYLCINPHAMVYLSDRLFEFVIVLDDFNSLSYLRLVSTNEEHWLVFFF